ncbi:hypothetical protein [Gordonia sp. CPCC 205333]|uniref:hypothetical protein n=1 Tax=Gordonia sp. CPCC 205333 TaxID=3140790 RepID=UPI003AF3A789
MSKSITPDEGAAGNARVLEKIDGLHGVRVQHASCSALRSFASDRGDMTMSTGIQVTFRRPQADVLTTMVRYEVAASFEGAKEDEDGLPEKADRIWEISLVICADWAVPEDADIPDVDARGFALGQGVMTSHPYARETVQSLSTRMGYPPATLDIIRSPWRGLDSVEVGGPEDE